MRCLSCIDIVERFTLSLMLLIIAFRNLIEVSGTDFEASEGFVLPRSFGWFRGNNMMWTIFYVSSISHIMTFALLTRDSARLHGAGL